MDYGVPPVLDGLSLSAAGAAALPVRVCAEHLTLLGATPGVQGARHDGDRGDPLPVGRLVLRSVSRAGGRSVPGARATCTIHWQPQDGQGLCAASTEALVQAVSGLMAVHGWDRGVPRRL